MTVEINSLISLSNELWKHCEVKEPLIPRRLPVIQPGVRHRSMNKKTSFPQRDVGDLVSCLIVKAIKCVTKSKFSLQDFMKEIGMGRICSMHGIK
jgi:hypothetical protein